MTSITTQDPNPPAVQSLTARPGLNDKHRADLARQFDCDPSEVDDRLDARERMDAYIAERREYYGRGNM